MFPLCAIPQPGFPSSTPCKPLPSHSATRLLAMAAHKQRLVLWLAPIPLGVVLALSLPVGGVSPRTDPGNSGNSIKAGLSPPPQPLALSHPIICLPERSVLFCSFCGSPWEPAGAEPCQGGSATAAVRALGLGISPAERRSLLRGCSPAGDPSWERQAEGPRWGLLACPPPTREQNNSSLYATP